MICMVLIVWNQFNGLLVPGIGAGAGKQLPNLHQTFSPTTNNHPDPRHLTSIEHICIDPCSIWLIIWSFYDRCYYVICNFCLCLWHWMQGGSRWWGRLTMGDQIHSHCHCHCHCCCWPTSMHSDVLQWGWWW